MTLKGTALIEKKNVLNEIRSNNMTLQELRFFSIYLSKINARDISTRVVRFPLSEFQRIMDFGRLNINQLKTSTDSLLCKVVHVPDERGGYLSFTLFKRCRVSRDDNEEWFVEIDASDDALPLMFDFKTKYFTYELWNALRLKSANQVRMYEILKQYEHVGKRELKVLELRELLGITPNEYARWERFRVRVLDSCQQALKENTDICYTYERGKVGKGGKWLTIIFHIKKNAEYTDQLTLDEFIDLQPEPEPIRQNDEEYWKRIYETEDMVILAAACNYEFTAEQMNVIFNILCRTDIDKDHNTDSLLWGRERYLREMYAQLNEQAKRIIIKTTRFNYFRGMLENNAHNKR